MSGFKIRTTDKSRLKNGYKSDTVEKQADMYFSEPSLKINSRTVEDKGLNTQAQRFFIQVYGRIKNLLGAKKYVLKNKLQLTVISNLKRIGYLRFVAGTVSVLFIILGVSTLEGLKISSKIASNETKKEGNNTIAVVNQKNQDVLSSSTTDEDKVPFVLLKSPNFYSNIKYVPDKKVATYNDKINGLNIIVSQQEISEKDKANPTFLLTVAQSLNMNREVQSKKGSVFIRENLENNVQFVGLLNDNVLVLIQSEAVFQDADWVSYINNLE